MGQRFPKQELKMKKTVRKDLKMKLTRETLLGLEQPGLAGVAGGATTTAYGVSCDGSCNGCNTRNTCTSVYC